MKVTTDACLFGAWISDIIKTKKISAAQGLDIGTGTGLLSLMLAQTTAMQIDAIEIDRNAFAQASENIENSPWSSRIKLAHTSLQMFEPNKQYDVIFSNPPFYEKDLQSPNMDKNRAMHDASLTMHELFEFSLKNLKDDGCLFVLIPGRREKEIIQHLERLGYSAMSIMQVKQNEKKIENFRVMMCLLKTNIKEIERQEMAIRNNANNYTNTYKYLLNSFYL